MKITFKQTLKMLSALTVAAILGGCGGYTKLTLPESKKYINNFQKDYEQISKHFKDNTVTKWIQPSNKKEKCEIEVNFGAIDRTQDDSYKLFWDGNCKNGKANGLGRIFEASDTYEQSIITIYKKGKISNACIVKRELENETLMGECRGNELDFDFDFSIFNVDEFGQDHGTINNFTKIRKDKIRTKLKPTYNVVTKIYDNLNKFKVEQKYGTYGNIDTPIMIMQNTPFNNKTNYQLLYYNYGYLLSNDFFGTFNDKDQNYGHQVPDYKGGPIGSEVINDKGIERFSYPLTYIAYYQSIFDKVKMVVNKAEESYRKAQIIKRKYKNKICDNSIKVDFMNNKQYKDICNEDKYYTKLKQRIDNKLAQIEQRKHNKELVNAENSKARAQQRAAAAAESANFNQSIQNIRSNNIQQNRNFQLQQINSYIRYGY